MHSRVFQTLVMCGDDYAIISWREVMVKRPAVRRQEINNNKLEYQVLIMQDPNEKIASEFTKMTSNTKKEIMNLPR